MSDPTQDIATSDIDAEIDAILSEDEGPVEIDVSTPEGSATEVDAEQQDNTSDSFAESVKTLGLDDSEIPEDLDPSARSLIQRALDKANERVRGFQSGFDKARSDMEVKARNFDQLNSMPEFHEWLKGGQATVQPQPEAEPELDLESLPSDPMQRLAAIVDFMSDKKVREVRKEFEERFSAVGSLVGQMGWGQFVAKNPDAGNYVSDIRRLTQAGMTMDEAYRYAKGATIDPKSIEDRVISRVKEKLEAKRKATGAPLKQNQRAGEPAGDMHEYAAKHGNDAAFLKILEAAEKEVGFTGI